MKTYLFLFFLFSFSQISEAQSPRIAVVKPDGSTTIHTEINAAYNAASDDDYIYLPGGNFGSLHIYKRLHIIGAGSNLDSSQVTGITRMSTLYLYGEAQGGSIQGIYFYGSIQIPQAVDGLLIHNCRVDNNLNISGNPVENIIFRNNVLSQISGNLSNSLISNNIILSTLSTSGYLEINNNLFFYPASMGVPSNSVYKNNIFRGNSQPTNFSLFYNNVNCNPSGSQNENYENINESFLDIFEDPGVSPYGYDVQNDYHVKTTSGCYNSGTDGTDRGTYGGTYPWVEGMVPSNPHIYFKSVADTTNASGQLQVHFKVRTN